MKKGRPTVYSEKLATLICDQLADGQSLRQICAPEWMPDRASVNRWLGSNEAFATRYARAREAQGDFMADRVREVADKVEFGIMPPDAGRVVISALQWQAAKLRPKVYSDRKILAGDEENPVSLLAVRLDAAIARRETLQMDDVTPQKVLPDDGSDLV